MSDPGWATRTRFVSALARAAAPDGFVRDGNALLRGRPEARPESLWRGARSDANSVVRERRATKPQEVPKEPPAEQGTQRSWVPCSRGSPVGPPETLEVLFVQVNANDPFKVTLNVGVVSRFVDAFEASRAKGKGKPSWWDRFVAGERIGLLAPEPHDAWWTLKLDADMAPVVKQIMTAVRSDVLPWFDRLATNAALADHLDAKRGGAALTARRCMLYKAAGRDDDLALLAGTSGLDALARDLAAFVAP